jgi:enoyl-CoA hydratase/3-hydroxyacyl-CoA dehydrogenase
MGAPRVTDDEKLDAAELSDLLTLKLFVEAALVLEEGVATHRDIDFGLIAGAGLDPGKGLMPPFMRADGDGLDTVLARLEAAAERHGERFTPPTILRRLVAQGRLGQKAGQGFYAYPKPDADQPGEKILLETRGDIAIAWLANGAMNSISPQVVDDLEAVWKSVVVGGQVRALVVASSNPFVFCAGADVKAMAGFDQEEVTAFISRVHGFARMIERSGVATIAAVNGMALGGGCELAMACDVRIAARSALFGQPEIKLGIIPGFGGTQRLRHLVGAGRALEMTLVGDPIGAVDAYELGLVNRVVEDHELLDTALAWARRLAKQAPLAVAAIKTLSIGSDLDAGLTAEETDFPRIAASDDGREGIAAFLGRRPARWTGA